MGLFSFFFFWLFFILNHDLSVNDELTINCVFLFLVMPIFSFAFLTIFLFKNTYFITSKRIIILSRFHIRSGHLKKTIDFKDIAFIRIWENSLEVVQKSNEGSIYYNNVETEYIKKIYPRDKHFYLSLSRNNNKDINQKSILNLLIKQIPLFRHSNLEDIYLNSKNFEKNL